jgi:mRNA interferase RelE/StbE
MPAKSFILAQKVDKNLSKLPLRIQKKILKSFEIIKTNPVAGIKLHGELEKYFKYRVGDYRIVYTFDTKKSIVIVVKIEHRQGVYK